MRMGGGSTGTGTIIAVAQSKGGAGKTTLAAHLAVAWSAAGSPVALIDTDPQRSLTRWHQQREERLGTGNTGIDFASVGGSYRISGEVARRARDNEIVLIDSQAGGHPNNVAAAWSVREAMRTAHLVLVPVQPSPVDVWATLETLEMAARERVPALLVLNRVPVRAGLTSAMRQRLVEYEVGLARSMIGNRVGLAAALDEGYGIAESAAGSPAAEEIATLADELLDLLPASRAAA